MASAKLIPGSAGVLALAPAPLFLLSRLLNQGGHMPPKKKAATKHRARIKPSMTEKKKAIQPVSTGWDVEEYCAIEACRRGEVQRLANYLKAMVGRPLSSQLATFLCDVIQGKGRRKAGRPKTRQHTRRNSGIAASF